MSKKITLRNMKTGVVYEQLLPQSRVRISVCAKWSRENVLRITRTGSYKSWDEHLVGILGKPYRILNIPPQVEKNVRFFSHVLRINSTKQNVSVAIRVTSHRYHTKDLIDLLFPNPCTLKGMVWVKADIYHFTKAADLVYFNKMLDRNMDKILKVEIMKPENLVNYFLLK